ncbi:MAG: DUF4446 family protein [Trebonia sp.]
MPTYVAVFALLLGYVALVAAYLALRTLAKLRRATALLTRGTQHGQSLVEAVDRHAQRTDRVADDLAELRRYVARAHADTEASARHREDAEGAALRHVALVRYDAFSGISGRMSFSLALLDEHGDGVTVSAISGQSDTRVYAKPISDGAASSDDHQLSPEEQQAVRTALGERATPFARRAS